MYILEVMIKYITILLSFSFNFTSFNREYLKLTKIDVTLNFAMKLFNSQV